MKKSRIALIGFAIILTLIAAGCGGGGNGGGEPAPSNSYLPMTVGNSWDYLMTLAPDIVPVQEGSNQLFDYHETIVGTRTGPAPDGDGTLSYYIFFSVRDATDEYPERRGEQVRRQDDEAIYARVGNPAYDVPVLMLPPRERDTWSDPYFSEVTFTTVAVGERITVPAGTFTCAHVRQVYETELEGGGTYTETTESWFARGVGLVKEEAFDNGVKTAMRELTAYSIQ